MFRRKSDEKKVYRLDAGGRFFGGGITHFGGSRRAVEDDTAAGAAETMQITDESAGEESEPPAEREEPAAKPAEETGPRDVTDTLNWLLGVTLTGPDGAELGEDTPADAECLLTYTFAMPGDAGVHAGDTVAVTLPKEVSAADGAAFQILDAGGAAIATAAGDGQNIIVTFSGDIPAGAAGSFSINASFNAANISGENPVQISFPLSLGNAQTIGVDFAGETEESTSAVTAMDAAVIETTHTVSDGQTFDISTCVDGDTVFVDAGATATITGSKNVQIKCGAGVKLTLDSVESNTSGKKTTPALGFSGTENTLTLIGTNTLTSGHHAAGINVPGETFLTINGSGSLTVKGGSESAGIGCSGDGRSSFGSVTINSGIIKAIGGNLSNNYGGGGAGIGSGNYTVHSGTITINGGTVTANGGGGNYYQGGAGIGGGAYSYSVKVIINGGTVTATGGCYGAGIGGGYSRSNGLVEITGGTVKANGGTYAAGIGSGGAGANGGPVTISGGMITANGGANGGAGIGGGDNGSGGKVTISAGTVIANGNSAGGAGIGGGVTGSGGAVVITGGNVIAVGGGHGKNIGRGGQAGQYANDGTIKNTDGTNIYATNIRLEGSGAGGNEIQSITTDLAYSYGLNDVFSGADGNLFFYMPAGTKTTEVTTPDEDYGGTAVTSSGAAQVFSFIVQGKDGREIELQTAGGYIQWRYVGDDNWTNLEALADLTGETGEDGKSVELRTSGGYIQWRQVGDDNWTNLEALADITGADGREEKEVIEEIISVDGEAAVGIAGIAKTGTDGNVDTYTITFTDGTGFIFTVTNGLSGASATVNDKGELIFALGDGTKINLGDTLQIADDMVAQGAADAYYDLQSDEKGAATLWVALAALALALLTFLTFLSHIGIIRLPKRKNG